MLRFSLLAVTFLVMGICAAQVTAQFEFDKPPISYKSTPVKDAIGDLGKRIEAGQVKLNWDETQGWLPDLLAALDVPVDSQTLVFSKTSLQTSRISPSTPRAIYFNDNVYLGYIPGARFIELSAVDAKQGAVFYTVRQREGETAIVRDQHECMSCHGAQKTKGVPGFLVRSVFPDDSGQPFFGLGTTTTDHTTPLVDRFGGWYVTGSHGESRHRGNSFAVEKANPPLDLDAGANQTQLPARVKTNRYPTATSDIVAVMVLEHQTQLHNLITAASYESRPARFSDRTMNKILDRPEDHVSDSTRRRVAAAGDRVLNYLLFVDEAKLKSPIKGSSSFTKSFAKRGPRDSRTRSLREFDLQARMFKFPCSFLIYSDSFLALPKDIRDHVENRLAKILLGQDKSKAYAHLSADDRLAVLEILLETLPGFDSRVDAARNAQ